MREFLERTSVYRNIKNWLERRKQRREFLRWEREGKPLPPPHMAKQKVLKKLANDFDIKVLVETGTFYGDMLEALRADFERLYSIELSRELYEKAQRRFKGQEHITLLQGDSGILLERIVENLDRPALFWLDGHYSAGETARGEKDTPILEELEHILGAPEKQHVIVIDDARCFGTDPAYPTLEDLRLFTRSRRPDMIFSVENDSIRLIPESLGLPRRKS